MSLSSESQTPSNKPDQEVVPNSRFVSVEFPALVKDEQKALNLLGGLESVEQVANEDRKLLELHFRAGDDSSHPIYGDPGAVTNLVLKVTRKKRSQTEEGPPEYDAKIVGTIEKTIRFQGMADFQFLRPESIRKKQRLEFLPIGEDAEGETELGAEEEPLFIPPTAFSRVDTVQDYAFKSNPSAKVVELKSGRGAGVTHKLSIANPHGERFHAVSVRALDEGVPSGPAPDVVCDPSDPAEQAMRDLFEKRPIWSKRALDNMFEQYGVNSQRLKRYLPRVAYYFQNGPWRLLWCKFGIDPRKNSDCAKYQMIDMRLSPEQHKALNLKRRTLETHTPFRKKASARTSMPSLDPTAGTPAGRAHRLDIDELLAQDLHNVFSRDKLPSQNQTYYQLVDIRVPAVAKILESKVNTATCNPRTGWFSPSVFDDIRRAMKNSLDLWLAASRVKERMEQQARDQGRSLSDEVLKAVDSLVEGTLSSKEFLDGLKARGDVSSGDLQSIGEQMTFLHNLMESHAVYDDHEGSDSEGQPKGKRASRARGGASAAAGGGRSRKGPAGGGQKRGSRKKAGQLEEQQENSEAEGVGPDGLDVSLILPPQQKRQAATTAAVSMSARPPVEQQHAGDEGEESEDTESGSSEGEEDESSGSDEEQQAQKGASAPITPGGLSFLPKDMPSVVEKAKAAGKARAESAEQGKVHLVLSEPTPPATGSAFGLSADLLTGEDYSFSKVEMDEEDEEMAATAPPKSRKRQRRRRGAGSSEEEDETSEDEGEEE